MASFSRASTLIGEDDLASKKGENELVGENDSVPNLWHQAYERLAENEKEGLKFTQHNGQLNFTEQSSTLVRMVIERKEECEKRQWKLYTKKNGDRIMVRDIFVKISEWINKFKEVGDAAVQYDPGHAALPWAAVRFFLQVAINDSQIYCGMMSSMEEVSRIIALYTELETRVLVRQSVQTRLLSDAVVRLYTAILRFLIQAYNYYGKRTLTRVLESSLKGAKSVLVEPNLAIEDLEHKAYELVILVQHECLTASLDGIIANLAQNNKGPKLSNEDRRRRISAWINGIETKNTYEIALQNRHEGTCEWVLKLEDFEAWSAPQIPQGKLLWLHGPPGFGKTFMSARIIEHLVERDQGPVAYFFCVAENQQTRDPYSILKSWLSQLLEQDETMISLMEAVLANRTGKDQSLTRNELWKLFVAVGETIIGCTFVVDGFDECTDINSGVGYHTKDPRNEFLRDLVENLSATKSRALVVSRDVADIREFVGKISDSPGIERYEYQITAQNTSSDVEAFSSSVVKRKFPRKPEKDRDEIAKKAAKRSEGMFLWIKLLENEISRTKSQQRLREIVEKMPLGIGDAYEREVEKIIKNPRIEERNEAIMILRWVLFAVRPLQVKQLAEALIVSDDKVSERYPEEYLPDTWKESFVDEDYVQEIILRPCGSLLQLRSGKEDELLANKTVHFVHFSVKEYLSSLTNESVLGRALGLLDTRTEELRLARICLRYLTLNVFEEMSASSDNTTYPFLEYAAWAWFFHGFDRNFAPPNEFGHLTRRVFKPSSSSWRICGTFLENEFDDSAESKSAQENFHPEDYPGESDAGSTEYSWINDETIDDGSTGDLSVSQPSFHEVQNPAYYASLLGLQDVITWLEEQGIDCSCEGGRFGYPLQAAVVRKHKELIIHFLSRGIDPSQKGGLYACAIIAAAAVSTSEILNILLDAGANVMAKDAQGWTALHHAARRGNVDIVHILINHPECDKDAVTTGNTPKTALSLACEYGNEEVAFALLNQGATGLQTALPQNGDMPLHYAITYGHHKLACRLLDAGALFETKTRTGMTPLLIAIIENAPKVVKKLLEKNARVDLIYEDWTMLQFASSGADPEIVKLLIASGADVNQCGGNIQSEASSLLIATSRNRTDVISILLEHGATTERAAYFAVLYGHESAMSLLLDHGASITCIEETSQETLFDLSLRMKRNNISQDLVRRGSFRKSLRTTEEYLKSIDKGCDHDLAILTFLGDARKVESLFKEPIFISQDDLNEAFHIAAARGFLDILKMCIQKGASVNSRELTGRTALHAAAFHNYEEITEALVVNGASWFLEDSIGSTPIDLAVRRGQKALNLVQQYISDYSFVIRKRPSLLEDTSRNKSAATAQKIRKSLSGRWEGSYEYLSWFKGRIDEFAIEISEPEPVLASSTTFEEENYDIAGAFKIMGFVDEKGIVWFVKLYERHGWLYRGQLDESLKTFKGTWGKNRKLWQGTFVLNLVS